MLTSARSFNRYLAVAARVVRRSLKEQPRLQAERRGDMDLRFAKWTVSYFFFFGRLAQVFDMVNYFQWTDGTNAVERQTRREQRFGGGQRCRDGRGSRSRSTAVEESQVRNSACAEAKGNWMLLRLPNLRRTSECLNIRCKIIIYISHAWRMTC